MSYADVNLDLTSISVACFSGSNGAGKSALLDAITWGLWERARSSSDELVRIGETEMWVDLIFTYEERTYRIRRSRQKRLSKKGGKATTKGTLEFQVLTNTLDFGTDVSITHDRGISSKSNTNLALNTVVASKPQLKNTDKGHWKSLTAANMRSTQQLINELIRMEYDTFVNSAYLRQGHADEFTTRAPNERKQVLSEILGLSYFEQLRDSCRLSARETKAKIEVLDEVVQEIPNLASKIEELSNNFETSSIEFKEIEKDRDDLASELKEKRALYTNLVNASQKQEVNKAAIGELENDLAQLFERESSVDSKIKDLEELISKTTHIEDKAKRFFEVRTKTEELDRQSLVVQGINEKKHELKSNLATMRSRLELEVGHAKEALGEVESRLAKLDQETKSKDKVLKSYEEYKSLLDKEAQASSKQEAFGRLNKRAQELESDITESKIKVEAELVQKQRSHEELKKILTSKSSIDNQKLKLEEEAQLMEKYENELEHVEESGLVAKSEIESLEKHTIDLKRRILENQERIKELTEHDHTSICPLCSAPIVDRAKVIGRYNAQISGYEQEILETQEAKKLEEEKRAELRQEYKRLRALLEGRKDLDKKIGQFNERNNSIERASESASLLAKEIETLQAQLEKHDYAQVERESLVNIKAEMHKLEFDPIIHSNLQSEIRVKRHIESRYQTLKKDLLEKEKLTEKAPELKAKQKELLDRLESESYGSEVRGNLKKLEEELTKINYDRDKHLEFKNELAQLIPFADQLNEVEKARKNHPELVSELNQIKERIKSKQDKIKELNAESNELVVEVTKLESLKQEIAEVESNLDSQNKIRDQVSNQLAVLENQLAAERKALQALEEKKLTLKKLQEEKEDYTILAEAFGKKGIQAIIIENSIPEIESEANRILSRLTDNKMHVALVTQHKTKSGTMLETLDILIGDDMGTRNYELYSGGEAFKVNFAIRIALSRLLARRAGARLETLIIDEGFGSQDDKSRERLVRAIRSIQSDFSRIFVITHVSEVREMFPTQIQVVKENGVSRLQVVS